jgi:hypothetical protein
LFLLIAAAGLVLWVWWVKRQRAKEVAESSTWTLYRARVVAAQVVDGPQGEDSPMYWEGVLTYSYTVPGGQLEIGEYREVFLFQADGERWARPLRDTFVDVRVDPSDVTRSLWVKN